MPRRILAGLVALLALSACAPATQQSSVSATAVATATPTIGLTYIPNVQFSPFYLADADGDFARAGLAPTLRHHGASEGLFTAIAAGQEQFVIAGGDEMLQARAQGLDLIAVGAYFHEYPAVVIVPEASAIGSLADLKGHSIGIPGKYGENWFALLVALRTAGLTEADVEIKEIGYTQQAALAQGKVDAIVGFSNNEAVQFALGGLATRSLAIADGQVPLVSICLITTSEYAKANPDVVRRVATAMLGGVKTAVTDPDHALAASAKFVPGLSASAAQAAAKATLVATAKLWVDASGEVSGKLDPDQWTAMAAFMTDHGLLTGDADAAAAMSNEYLPK
ncbi:MAG TPA: ABC transporter substrate-binding protein [Propionicimonas sp.]|nr:ABC transporter substrate-binding protein [Propionicimonas sp.]